MTDVETEIRSLLETAADQSVGDPPLSLLHRGAGRRQRARHGLQLVGVCAAIAGIVVAAVLVVNNRQAPPVRPVHVPASTPTGPSASQLEHGHWIAIPKAPIRACEVVIPDGIGVIAICPHRAAAYDATTNTWHEIAAPPTPLGSEPVAAWGGGRLVAIARYSGRAYEWRPATNRWTSIAPVPGAPMTNRNVGVDSVVWTGSGFATVVITRTSTEVDLLDTSGKWTATPALPTPLRGRPQIAILGVLDGRLFVALEPEKQINYRNGGMTFAAHVEVDEFESNRWVRIITSLGTTRGLNGTPGSLTTLSGGLLVIGDECPEACMEDSGAASIIRIARQGTLRSVTQLHLRDTLFESGILAASGNLVAAIYPRGVHVITTHRKATPLAQIYNITTRRWADAPSPPQFTETIGAYWTSSGVLMLDDRGTKGNPSQLHGALLTP